MGEAKRRMLADKNFGVVPKSAGERGLIVSPPIEIRGNTLFAKSTTLDPQELRFALLFWDRLVWPSSRAIHFASGPDEAFLESAGVLRRPDYTVNGDAAQGIAAGQINAFLDLNRAEPGVWALAQGDNSLLLRDKLLDNANGAAVELHRAIAIPKHDVPLAEILEFKERRRDELLRLRFQLESFVAQIEAAPDKLDALEKRLAELDASCADLLTVGKLWQFPMLISNLKASFSLSPVKFLPAVAGGWKLGEPYGLLAAAAVAASAGAVSTIDIKGDIGFRSINRPTSPYRYAYLLHEELR